MSVIGTVESLWRYPVKSMRGEEMNEIFASYAGVYGDRLFAFTTSAGQESFPWFTGRDYRSMIRYQPRFRYPDKAAEWLPRIHESGMPSAHYQFIADQCSDQDGRIRVDAMREFSRDLRLAESYLRRRAKG